MTQQELEKYLWGAATALRGTIDAGDYKQYIFPLLFFRHISDVYDEEFSNALAESDGDLYASNAASFHCFWRTVKYEHLYAQAFNNLKEVRSSLTCWFDWYNQEHFHQGLNNQTPDEVYYQKLSRQQAA
ncbi:integrase-like protein [Nitrosomonas nitrosa]|uniref:type I restriction-modification system subunit M N-terminal domain-containing protein n=1 Tax=Nitrosomonas nitrosa TaxID=52442 RepID=UPI000D316D8C|nr:type I restriction-modification system subunit M N-terminal domain-containing protein [Nitrosomonas nitrosa]PTQ92623.1 integrase-like protein [Nitrosomonas nitrosa]